MFHNISLTTLLICCLTTLSLVAQAQSYRTGRGDSEEAIATEAGYAERQINIQVRLDEDETPVPNAYLTVISGDKEYKYLTDGEGKKAIKIHNRANWTVTVEAIGYVADTFEVDINRNNYFFDIKKEE